MSKTLSTIQTIFKVAAIVAKVIFILCLVGGGGCLLAMSVLPLLGLVFGPILPAELLVEEGFDLAAVMAACAAGFVSCGAEAVFAFFAERYFSGVGKAGTPFTEAGAKECFRLGLISLITSVAASVLSGFVFLVFLIFATDPTELDVSTSATLITGVFFLFLSLIFKHGAELKAAAEEKREEGAAPSAADGQDPTP